MRKVNLFTNYYQCGDKNRQKELDFCRDKNKEGLFDRVINFENRPTYHHFFEATQQYPDDINIFSNSDIYFNETIKLVHEIQPRQAYALTRWELEGDEIVKFEEKHQYNAEAKSKHSQDVWVFSGAVSGIYGNFHIGTPGCDNRIAYEISRKYSLLNPSNKIQCIHKHKEQARNYTISKAVPPPYMWVNVNGIEQPRRRRI